MVTMDGNVIPTDTPEDIQDLVTLLNDFLRLYNKRPRQWSNREQPQLPLSYPGVRSINASMKMSEWLTLAWSHLGRPDLGATSDEIYRALIDIGYTSTAADPKAAVKAAIRLGGQFMKVATQRNQEAVWLLIDGENDVEPPRFSMNDPQRQSNKVKSVDYAVRALKDLGGVATKEELAKKMTEYGWDTKSEDRPALVAATIRKYREFEKRGSLWAFSAHYKDRHEEWPYPGPVERAVLNTVRDSL